MLFLSFLMFFVAVTFDLRNKPYEEIFFITDRSACRQGFKGIYEQIPCDNIGVPVNPPNPVYPTKPTTPLPPPPIQPPVPQTPCSRDIQDEFFLIEVYAHHQSRCVFNIQKLNPVFGVSQPFQNGKEKTRSVWVTSTKQGLMASLNNVYWTSSSITADIAEEMLTKNMERQQLTHIVIPSKDSDDSMLDDSDEDPDYQPYEKNKIENAKNLFDRQLLKCIADQSNLYAVQKNPNKPSKTNEHELEHFIGTFIYMSVYGLPRTRMYWAANTRVEKVADPSPMFPDIGASSNIVLRMAEVIPQHCNHLLYSDNWFLSPNLCIELAKVGIGALTTIRTNRFREVTLSSDLTMKNRGRGYMCLVSSWLLYRDDCETHGISHIDQVDSLQFRTDVTAALCCKGKQRGRPRNSANSIDQEHEQKQHRGPTKPISDFTVRREAMDTGQF
ncbi:hypothetical protein ILUMI_20285 [Ignelater luminosus]|uniref:PiggyBac transposable element-derived protein domain-containing protein n=1 Tax=Ignelater luminosus TaxID=2038154 RepID=A0A8K0CIH6_IGNLU|nr:hypothetical protein ILUMI_20285 [Ignelater luminosus]